MHNSLIKQVDSKGQITAVTYTPDQKINVMSYQDINASEIKRIEYSYDLLGNTTKEVTYYTNPIDQLLRSHTDQYVYNAYGLLTTSVDSNAHATNYDYDNNHRLVKTTYPNGLETINVYDSVTGELISTRQVDNDLIDGSQRNTFYEYNVFGEVNKQTFANDSFVLTTYTPDGQIASTSYSNNDLQDASDDHVITYSYDTNGRLLTTTDNSDYDQTTATYQSRTLETRTYDRYGALASVTSLNGAVTSFAYDQYGRLITTTQEDIEHSSYDDGVFTTQTTDLITTTSYDLLDRVVSVSEPNGFLTTNVYDEIGNVMQVITSDDDTDLTTIYTYDRFNNIKTTTDHLGQTTTTTYDALNQLVKKLDPNQEYTIYDYDDSGNLIKQEYFSADASKSEKVEYVYDSMDQLTQTKEYRTNNGVLTPYLTTNTYTKFGELASIQDPTGYTILYQYDDMGNKIHADYDDQNEIAYEYDKNNRLVEVTYSTRSTDLYNQFTVVETYDYYRDGKLRLYVPNQPDDASTKAKKVYYYYQDDQLSRKVTTLSSVINGAEVISEQDAASYSYDQRDQLTELSDKLGKTLYYYDDSQNLTKQTRVDQLVTYDNAFNEIARVDQTSQTVGYCYDRYHDQTAIIYPDNTSVYYTYDALQRLSSVIDQNGMTTYTYDILDNEITESLPSDETTVTTYQLGKISRKLTTYFDAQLNQLVTLVDQSLTYDEMGNVLTDTLSQNGVVTTTVNTYEERSQLLSSVKTEGTEEIEYSYVLDPFGNKNEVIKYYSNNVWWI